MEIRENSLAIACLIALALLFPLSRSQDYINAHNAARAEVGVGPPSWDDNVAAYAQNYTNALLSDCRIALSRGP
jgi:pathogenesis-related protein 1